MKLEEPSKTKFDPQIPRDAKQMSVATSRFARGTRNNEPHVLFWVPSDKRDTCKLIFPTIRLAVKDRCRAVLKISLEGATLFGDRRGSLRRNKRDPTERAFVRPLYY